MPESILVTGATGHIGRSLVKLLCATATDKRIVAGTRNPAKAGDLASAGAHLIELDLNDPGSTERAVAGVGRVFLLTPSDLNTVQQANNVIAAAESARITRIVRLSVIQADLEPGITLTRLHRSVEKGIVGSGIDHVFLRPNGFMQNFETLAPLIKASGMFPQSIADAKVSYVDVDDIAQVAAKALLDDTGQYSGKAYDLTGPESLSLFEVAEIFSNVLEREVKYMPVTDDDVARSLAGSGMPQPLIEALVELFEFYRQGKAAAVSSGISDVTGSPATTFEEYVEKNREVYS